MISKLVIDLIEKGIKQAYLKMLEEKSKNDEGLVVSDEHGKIVHLKARDVLNELKKKGFY